MHPSQALCILVCVAWTLNCIVGRLDSNSGEARDKQALILRLRRAELASGAVLVLGPFSFTDSLPSLVAAAPHSKSSANKTNILTPILIPIFLYFYNLSQSQSIPPYSLPRTTTTDPQ